MSGGYSDGMKRLKISELSHIIPGVLSSTPLLLTLPFDTTAIGVIDASPFDARRASYACRPGGCASSV